MNQAVAGIPLQAI